MRISTTTLESFRLFMQPDQDWMDEADLIATIQGRFTPTPHINIGSAYGKVLEHPDKYRVSGGYRVPLRDVKEPIELGDDVMQPALDLIRTPTVFEAKGVGRYLGHDVVAKADQLHGLDLIETKTTFSSFDFDKYDASCQWKFMADIFNVPRVIYQVACLGESKDNGVIYLKNLEVFSLYPYDDMWDELLDLVRDFVRYVDARHLRAGLEQRQQDAVAGGW